MAKRGAKNSFNDISHISTLVRACTVKIIIYADLKAAMKMFCTYVCEFWRGIPIDFFYISVDVCL